ncbi:hypothetical protein [Lysobacter gummosus]|uniref:Dolichyl-phosphate-mannose-mannosyltransferase family protein n=1 Tax=Lysobacter gummosus TaxID=262324 RepID=A0ABY3X622_9GAMM|nr:hypothetical protein [Lysobacter gummosus]ALN92437.1 dolichyl-phosphate-mannose-mannosyltransferase family protein [Lysobacter gummosus]UNP28019.1 hypothetical protein MOV92_16120 [Lysobacter gummosus]
MEYLKALAELGVWLAVYPLGAGTLALTGHDARHLRRNVLIVICTGSAIATALLMALAAMGLFAPTWIGAAGWIVLAVWSVRNRAWAHALERLKNIRMRGASALSGLAVIAILATATGLYAFFPKESLLGERDEGIYAQHALHLLRTGGSAIDLVAMGLAREPGIVAVEQGKAAALPGIYPTGSRWTFQFSSATPVWMAVLGAMLGPQGIFRFNAVVGLLNCMAFYALTRRVLAPAQRVWAIAAVAVFAFQPAQVWISRNCLSEPLSTWFVLNGLLAAILALSQRSRTAGLIAGGLIGMSGFVRIDAVVFPLAASAACLFVVMVNHSRRDQASNPAVQAIMIGCFAAIVLAVAYFAVWVRPYLDDLFDRVAGAVVAAALCAGLVRLLQLVPALRLGAQPARKAAWLAALAIVGLLVYAIWIRPHLQPFALEPKIAAPPNDQRDYRENSVLNVAAYLSWPVVIAAGFGAAWGLWSTLRGGLSPIMGWVLVFLLTPALVYLWWPMVSPDHIWASRRWVPTVFPAAVVLAAVACARLSRRWRGPYAYAAAGLITVVVSAHLLMQQRETLRVREDAGMVAQIGEIARRLPDDRVSYVVGSGTLTSALLAGFGSRVVQVAVTGQYDWTELCPRVAGRAEQGCWVVHPKSLSVGERGATWLADVPIKRLRRNTSVVALARGTHEDGIDWSITKIEP